MASLKLSVQDKKDLDKFTKFLALKAAQIIVQSRLGDKISTQSKPYTSGTDWFNLAVQDLPDVVAEAKQAICSEVGTTRLPVCVEISLRTAEGDTMILETWCLSSMPEQCDPTIRVTYTVYNRMGILLKSLVSVTRVTPAYKLSRRQSPDSYVICYRIYMGEPQLHNLGDGYKQVRVGQLCTPIGTLHLSVAYRTKMTISPTQVGKDSSMMVKSDHFNPETDTKQLIKKNEEQYEDMINRPLKKGAFVDPEKINYPEIIPKPFQKLWEKPKMKESTVQVESSQMSPKPVSLIGKKKKESVFKEIRPLTIPFADPECNTWTQVSHLYWYFKDAPSLESLENGPTIGEQDIPGQLAEFQKRANDYNSFVKQLLKTSKDEESEEDDDKKKGKSKKEKRKKNLFSVGQEGIDVRSESCLREQRDSDNKNLDNYQGDSENNNTGENDDN